METGPSPTGIATPEAQIKSLRSLLHATAISLLILTGTLFIFIYREVVLVRKQSTELVRYLMEYERSNAEEFIEQVRMKFDDFRKDHPDFQPLYLRYFGTNQAPSRVQGANPLEPTEPAEPGAGSPSGE